MFGDIGSIIILSFLSLTGVEPATQIPTVPAISCEAQPADSCLSSDICDVFVSSSGGESCALACDLRDVASCESDGACAVTNGVCNYPESNPVGC